jgi:hypothetical protein
MMLKTADEDVLTQVSDEGTLDVCNMEPDDRSAEDGEQAMAVGRLTDRT